MPCDNLNRALLIVPRYGLANASRVVDLVKSEITERDTPGFHELAKSPGLLAWCADIDHMTAEFQSMSCEERTDSPLHCRILLRML